MTKRFSLEDYSKDPTLKIYYRCGKKVNKIRLTNKPDWPIETESKQWVQDESRMGNYNVIKRHKPNGKIRPDNEDDSFDLYLTPKGERFEIPYETRYIFLYKNLAGDVLLSDLYINIKDLEIDMDRLKGFCFTQLDWEIE